MEQLPSDTHFLWFLQNRFSTEPETYKQFLEILQTYQKEQKPIHDVSIHSVIHHHHSSSELSSAA